MNHYMRGILRSCVDLGAWLWASGEEAVLRYGMARVFLSLVFAAFAWAAAAQEEVILTPEQVQVLAERAVQAGDFPAAERLSSLVLSGDPENPRALLTRAAVARAAGALDDAAELAARSHGLAENPAVRFEAAMLVADVRARQERFTTSQIWLRRADQAAPDARRRDIAANAYRQVSRANPFSVQLRFTAQPSNNVNNGAETTVIEIGGLPFSLNPSGQQLGGYEANVGMSLGYRLNEDQTQRTDLLSELFYRKIWLDSEAEETAPNVRASDFDYGALVLGLRHSRLVWPDLGVTRATGLLGQSWYGGDELARWGELQLSQQVRQGDDAFLTFGTSMRRELRLDDDINSNYSLALSLDRAQVFGDGRVSYGASVKNVWSNSNTVDNASVQLRGSWALGEVNGLRPTLTGSVERRNYHQFSTTGGTRRDTTASIGMTVVFPDVSYFGFAPQLEMRARRTWSNVDIYDRNAYSVGVTAVSRF